MCLALPKVAQCIKVKSFRWQKSQDRYHINMKNAFIYCHPMAGVIYIEANFPAGNTRLLRLVTNQVQLAKTDIQLDGNNLSISMETCGKSFYDLWSLGMRIAGPNYSKLDFLEKQRFELEFQNPVIGQERKCFERLGQFSI